MIGIRDHLLNHRSDEGFKPQGMPEPTQAFPGSTEKIAILAARLGCGLELHHPQDNFSRRSGSFDSDFDETN